MTRKMFTCFALLAISTFEGVCSWEHDQLSLVASEAESTVRGFLAAQASQQRVSSRKKRQALCVAECVQTMAKKLGNEYKESSSGMVNPKMFNSTEFQRLCNLYKIGKQCIDDCEFTPIKQSVKAAFKSLDYLCVTHYDEFLSYTPCYVKTYKSVSSKCNPICGDHSSMNRLRQEQEKAKQRGDLGRMGQILSCMCSFLKCQLSCMIPIYNDQCETERPGKFMENFAESVFGSLQDLMTNNGMGFLWPQECRDVADGNYEIVITDDLNDGQGVPCLQEILEDESFFLF